MVGSKILITDFLFDISSKQLKNLANRASQCPKAIGFGWISIESFERKSKVLVSILLK